MKTSYIFMPIVLMALTASGLSFAADGAPGSLAEYFAATPSGDWSIKLWVSVLGEFALNPFSQLGGPTTLLGKLFIIFNGAIFVVATAFMSYGLISAIVGTGQDGSPFGQRINTAWYPVRTVTGITGLMPVLGGFTPAQAFLMWVASLGIGIANLMFSGAVANPQLTQLVGNGAISGAPAVRHTQVEATLESLMRANVCTISYQRHNQVMGAWAQQPVAMDEQVTMRTALTDAGDGAVVRFGTARDPSLCGSVQVTLDKYRDEDSITAFRVQSVDYQGIKQTVAQAAINKLVAAQAQMQVAAQTWMTKVDNYIKSDTREELRLDLRQLDVATGEFLAAMAQIVSGALKGKSSSIAQHAQLKMRETGWIGAGAWFSTFAEANAALADATRGINFAWTDPQSGRLPSTVGDEVMRFNFALSAARAARLKSGDMLSGDAVVGEALKDVCSSMPSMSSFIGTATGNCSLGQAIVSQVIGMTMRGSGGGSAGFFAGSGDVGLVNPIIAFKNLGDYVMTVGGTLISSSFIPERIAAKAAGMASSAVKWLGTATGMGQVAAAGKAGEVLSGTAETAMTYATPLGWTMIVIGGLCSLYIPFLPFIAWFSGLLVYTASFLEGLIAMPLHSMAHLHNQGEGMGSQTSKGYLFFLNTLIRPAVMVIAFFAASALCIALGTLLAHLFLPAMASVQGNSMTGLFSIVGLLAIYLVMNITLTQSCFELVTVIPDQVISYVGAGDLRGALGHNTEQKINAMFMASARGGMGSLQQSAVAGATLQQDRGKRAGDSAKKNTWRD